MTIFLGSSKPGRNSFGSRGDLESTVTVRVDDRRGSFVVIGMPHDWKVNWSDVTHVRTEFDEDEHGGGSRFTVRPGSRTDGGMGRLIKIQNPGGHNRWEVHIQGHWLTELGYTIERDLKTKVMSVETSYDKKERTYTFRVPSTIKIGKKRPELRTV